MKEYKTVEDLQIYKKACELRKAIFELVTQQFPKEEKYRLGDQLIRSTRKCPANIAEGYGRFHFQENIQFCRIARGSLTENLDHLNCALECKYIRSEQKEKFFSEIKALIKMLNGYIKYLETQKQKP